MRTVGGHRVWRTRVFREGHFWRWKITMANGSVYLDGGNYHTEAAARQGLPAAFDRPTRMDKRPRR